VSEASPKPPRAAPWWKLPLQLSASVLVLALLAHDAELDAVGQALAAADLRWLFVAAFLKLAGLTLHEVRLWIAVRAFKPLPLWRVAVIGYVSGLANSVLPVRGGDLVCVGLLRQELKVPTPAAAAAVGITGFLEAAIFGLFTLGVLVFGATRWEEMLGAAQTAEAKGWLTLAVLGSVFGAVVIVMLGRRLGSKPKDQGAPGPGPIQLLKDTIVSTGEGLTAWGHMLGNAGLAVVHVALVVASFWALFPALGLELDYPLIAACGVIAIGSIAAVVLPPTMAAGTAATSIFVLGFFGVTEAQALAFTALSWCSNTLPPVLTGFVPLVRRIGRIRELLRGETE
jgi:uncharacterized membrane protein YbhN (UPF0104 family)